MFFYVSVFTGAFQELQLIQTQHIRTADGNVPDPLSMLVLNTTVWGITVVRQVNTPMFKYLTFLLRRYSLAQI